MGRCIVRLSDDRYLEWSTVVDAPVSYSWERPEAIAAWGEDRIKRADRYGSSFHHKSSAEDVLVDNRAGPGESWIPMHEICRLYHPETK